MTDLRIIPDKSGDVCFDTIYGACKDSGLMLLQRLYILLLSDPRSSYRENLDGHTLLSFLEGGNYPMDAIMNSMLAICCANAVNSLDAEDSALVSSFTGVCTDGIITCTLTLQDGTTIEGVLNG